MRVVSLAAVAIVLVGGSARGSDGPVAVAFWTRTTGVAVFADRNPNVVRIERTEDGGRTWRVVAREQWGYAIGVTPGTRRVWVETRASPCPNPVTINCLPHLVGSDDGGRTWKPTEATASASVSFAGATGWAPSAVDSSLWETRDGGDSWRKRPGPCFHDTPFPSFATPRVGRLLCAGQPGAGSQLKELFVTADGGRTWTRRGHVPSAGYAGGLLFTTARDGWIWGSRTWPLRTHDGGRTWRAARLASVEDEVFDMAAAGGRLWRVVRVPPVRYSLERSDDGGFTWQRVRG